MLKSLASAIGSVACMATPAVTLASPVPQVQVNATAPELLQLAERFEQSGDRSKAKIILAALFSDPSRDIRNEARFRQAKLLIAEGETNDAAILLRRILDERPGAAPVRLELAGLLDRMGDKDGAWRQVRAAQAAGLPPSVARIVDRYSESLRGQRPFGVNLEIAIAPDSNINRATRSESVGTLLGKFDISEDGKAKSGTGLSLHAQAYRRLPLGADSSLLFRLTGAGSIYLKPDFNDVAADIGVGPEFALGRSRIQLELGLTQRWFGQERFTRSARLSGTISRPLGHRTLLRVSGSAALVDNQVNELQDGKSWSSHVDLERALSPTTGIAASFSFDRQSLRGTAYSTTGWRGGLTAWREVGRMTLTASAELGRLQADERLVLLPYKRADKYSRLSFGATFRRLQFHGFAPIARFSIERNASKVEFYDYRRARTELGVVRAF